MQRFDKTFIKRACSIHVVTYFLRLLKFSEAHFLRFMFRKKIFASLKQNSKFLFSNLCPLKICFKNVAVRVLFFPTKFFHTTLFQFMISPHHSVQNSLPNFYLLSVVEVCMYRVAQSVTKEDRRKWPGNLELFFQTYLFYNSYRNQRE